MSKFSSYTVGYIGDFAGVILNYETPVVVKSSKPKDKHNRELFDVIHTSQSFNQASLKTAILDSLEQKDYSTYVTLLNAQFTLNHFIHENGLTNPYEATDWEIDRAPALKMA